MSNERAETRIIGNIVVPILIFVVTITICVMLWMGREVPPKKEQRTINPVVDVTSLKSTDFDIIVKSRGTVEAHTQSSLISEVSGKIITVSKNFRNGEFISKGETLVTIDKRNFEIALVDAEASVSETKRSFAEMQVKTQNYDTQLKIAKAKLATAKLSLVEEEARAEQALKDWQDLGLKEKPGKLVLREPQLDAAKAAVSVANSEIELRERDIKLKDAQLNAANEKVKAALATVSRRKLDIERCEIKAPYSGRILKRHVDIGEYISSARILADIYATDFVEVRLPIANRDLDFITLPEIFSKEDISSSKPIPVVLISQHGSKKIKYPAQIVRTQGTVDTKSRQIFAIARVETPYDHQIPLKVGTFVQAEIKGTVLKGVYVLPRNAVHNEEILIIDKHKMMRRKTIKAVWKSPQTIVIDHQFKPGERLSLTNVSFARDQEISVQVKGEVSDLPKRKGKAGKNP